MQVRKHIDFVGKRRFFITVSAIFCVLSLVALVSYGLQYGIDFIGGTEVQLRFQKETSVSAIRQALVDINMQDAVVQIFGDEADNEFLIRLPSASINPERFDPVIKDALAGVLSEESRLTSIRYVGDKAYAVFRDRVPEETILQAIRGVGNNELNVYRVASFGKESENEYLIQFGGITKVLTEQLSEVFGKGAFELRREDSVGPKVGAELRRNGVIAVLLALAFILIYIWMRFDMNFAPGAILALMHDVLLTLGVFSVFRIEMNLPIIAALLTIVGYSLNDTIVVFDRIRENLKSMKGHKLEDVVNTSLNQTLSRTLMTSVTTLLVTGALLTLGGAIIHNFALALTLGVFFGTYSSVFIAAPVVIALTHYNELKRVKAA